MGIIGFGRIGQTTGRLAQALGMKVLACDTSLGNSGAAIAEYVDLHCLLANAMSSLCTACFQRRRKACPPSPSARTIRA